MRTEDQSESPRAVTHEDKENGRPLARDALEELDQRQDEQKRLERQRRHPATIVNITVYMQVM